MYNSSHKYKKFIHVITDEECFFYSAQCWICIFPCKLLLAYFYEVVEESTGDPLGEHKKGFGGICKE